MSDLRDFLENIRKFSPKIGEVAMRHVSGLISCSFLSVITAVYFNLITSSAGLTTIYNLIHCYRFALGYIFRAQQTHISAYS
jgi:hypothetical protein